MRIAVVGPVDLSELGGRIQKPPAHYAFPLIGQLAGALLERGHEVVAITSSSKLSKPWRFTGDNLNVTILPDQRRPRAKVRDRFAIERAAIASEIIRYHPDLVNGHWLYEFGAAAAESGLPAFIVGHDHPVEVLRYQRHAYWWSRVSLALSCRRSNVKFAGVAPSVVKQLRALRRGVGDVALLPNWSPPNMEFDAWIGGTSSHAFTLVSILNGAGRLKNPRNAIRGFALARARLPTLRLVMVGDGYGPTSATAEWARQNRLTNGIDFIGSAPHAKVLDILRYEADLLIHPSRTEACSITILEAMALGVPVIGGRNSGGVPWQLAGGRAGILTDVNSPTEISESILKIAGNPGERERLVNAAHERQRLLFSFSRAIDRYESWFLDPTALSPID